MKAEKPRQSRRGQKPDYTAFTEFGGIEEVGAVDMD
jgi:hypothetical protein